MRNFVTCFAKDGRGPTAIEYRCTHCGRHDRGSTRTWIPDQCDLQYGHKHDAERVVFGLLTRTRPSIVRWEEGGSKASALKPLVALSLCRRMVRRPWTTPKLMTQTRTRH
jgi:hypothetical protein